MEQSFKDRLCSREKLVGTLLTLPCMDTAEMLSMVGFDFFWIETEHTPLDFSHAQSLIQAVGNRCACLVRVPENRDVYLKRALDIGCDGVIVPQVHTVEMAEQVVRSCLYPPLGERGVGLARAHGYGMSFEDYVEHANERISIVVQIENHQAVDNIEAIVEVQGLDAILIGPYDLSSSFGLLGQIDHPTVEKAIERVISCSAKAGMPVGMFIGDPANVSNAVEQGVSLIGLSTDSMFLWKGAKEALGQARK